MAFQPSQQQQDILDWAVNGQGSANIVARAGSGKTSTLMLMVDALAAAGHSNIYLGAFNRAIAQELKTKLEAKGVHWQTAQAGTLHSAGYRAWRRVAKDCEINDRKMHTVLDGMLESKKITAEDYDKWRNFVVKAASLAKQSAFGILNRVSDTTSWLSLIDHYDLMDAVEDDDPDFGIETAVEALRISHSMDRQVIDFDDMIWAPLMHQVRLWQYDWIMVDEAQDTNQARRALAMAMLKPNGRLVAVGDDRQAIYGFAGADADAMDQIAEQLNSKVFPLTTCYRCAEKIVKHAAGYVQDIQPRQDAPAGEILHLRNDQFNPKALGPCDVVLCRNNAPLVEMAYDCIRSGVACRIEGKDVGSGLIALATRWSTDSLAMLLNRLSTWAQREMAKAAAKTKNRDSRMAAIEDKAQTMVALIEAARSKHGKDATVSDLVSLIRSMFGDSQDDPTPVLTFSSVHKSKGREWRRVHLYGAERYMPSKYARSAWQQTQEQNLIYVAITRAQETLVYVEAPKKEREFDWGGDL